MNAQNAKTIVDNLSEEELAVVIDALLLFSWEAKKQSCADEEKIARAIRNELNNVG